MKKLYVLAIFSLFVAQGSQCVTITSNKKKVFFINGVDGEEFSVKGPFRKNDRYVSSETLRESDVDPVEFEASDSELFYVRFLTGGRYSRDRVAKEFTTKFPKPYTAIIFTKTTEKDKDGNDVVDYHAWKADAFTEAKLIDPKSF